MTDKFSKDLSKFFKWATKNNYTLQNNNKENIQWNSSLISNFSEPKRNKLILYLKEIFSTYIVSHDNNTITDHKSVAQHFKNKSTKKITTETTTETSEEDSLKVEPTEEDSLKVETSDEDSLKVETSDEDSLKVEPTEEDSLKVETVPKKGKKSKKIKKVISTKTETQTLFTQLFGDSDTEDSCDSINEKALHDILTNIEEITLEN